MTTNTTDETERHLTDCAPLGFCSACLSRMTSGEGITAPTAEVAPGIRLMSAYCTEHECGGYILTGMGPARWTLERPMGIEEWVSRIDHLRRTRARTKFLSLEPLLGPLDKLDLSDIDWVIAGGESGPGARPMPADWVRSIRDQCIDTNVAFHFKQWGGKNKKRTGRILDGRTWDEWPNSTNRARRSKRAASTRTAV